MRGTIGEISERTADVNGELTGAVEVVAGVRLAVVGLARMFSNASKALSLFHEYESQEKQLGRECN